MIEPLTTRRLAAWLLGLCLILATIAPRSADAHGIAGNRLFPGTLAIDDPAVNDESRLPLFLSAKHPGQGGDVDDNRFSWSFFRLLTPTLAAGVDSGWAHRNWGIFFGKGFGDLPDSLAWLRPFGITGAVTLEHPMTGNSINFGVDPLTGQLAPMLTRNVDILHWGFAVEFSTLYLTNRFTPGKLPKKEPLNQLVPLVEFSFDSPRGQKTVATMNPGLAYVAESWQVAAEAIVPLNSEAGRSIGGRAQLLLFLQDLIPSVFGKPLLSDR